MPRESPPKPDHHPKDALEPIDINRVVSFNLRAARELRGLTQEVLARRLENVTGTRLTQAGVSALERTWEGGKRREFDAQEIVEFAQALDVPIIWFFLPPPGDDRKIKNADRPLFDLIELLVGRNELHTIVEGRLRAVGLGDPTAVEQTSRMLIGWPDGMSTETMRERRDDMLEQILNEMADDLDEAAKLWGKFWDRVRQTTVRGLIAERTNNDRFLYRETSLPGPPDDLTPFTGTSEPRAVEDSAEHDDAAAAGASDVAAAAVPARLE